MEMNVAPAGPASVWELLERFMHQLNQADSVQRQLRLTLEMVRGATRADVAFLYSAQTRRLAEWVGPALPDLDGLAERAGVLIDAAVPTAGQFLRASLPPAGRPASQPASAALLRLSRSRGAWVVAFRFGLEAPFTDADLRLMSLARRLLHQQQGQQATYDQLREMLFGLVRCLTSALDARDPYTWGHSERVARIAVRLATQLGQPESQRSELYLGGLLHDIGKIGVPDAVLRKPGKLTDEEFDQVKQHVLIGDAVLAHVRQLTHLRPVVRSHHEQYDGQGYPDGLRGDNIPLLARITAVADSCDAMMSDRPYRKGLPAERIEAILTEGAGRQWDPTVVEAFFACRREVFSICQRGLGDSVLQAVEHALDSSDAPARAVRTFLMRPSPQGVGLRPTPEC
jgi:HD-GYP domain-containing protein (c-di-GMP phosphodiesterase class II)